MATPTDAVLVTILVVVALLPSADAAPGRGQGCVFEGVVHAQGSQVVTEEPCLNCTCLRGALVCHLKVCPDLPDPPPRGCILLHRKDECCPKLVCHKNAAKQPTGVFGHKHDVPYGDFKNGSGCVVNGTGYAEGSAMASSSLCEYCYCIRGKQQCVEPKCLLHLVGCKPSYTTHSCCPTSYNCRPQMPDTPDGSTIATTTTTAPKKMQGCTVGGERYAEGTLVSSVASSDCENCFCVKGKVRCMSLAFAPPLQGCNPIVKKGECWPASYNCSGTTMNLQMTETDFILKNVVGDRKLPNSVRSMPVIPAATPNILSSTSTHQLGLTVEGRANNKLMNISQEYRSDNQTIITIVEKSEPSKSKNTTLTIEKTSNSNLTETNANDTNKNKSQEHKLTSNNTMFSTEPVDAVTDSTNTISYDHASESNSNVTNTDKVHTITSTDKALMKTDTKLPDPTETTPFITSTITTTLSTTTKSLTNINTTNMNNTHSSSISTPSINKTTLSNTKTTLSYSNTTVSAPNTTPRSNISTALSITNTNTTPSTIPTLSDTNSIPSINTTLTNSSSTQYNKTTPSDDNTTQSSINTTLSSTNQTPSSTNTTIINTNTSTLTDETSTQPFITTTTLSDASTSLSDPTTPTPVSNVTRADNETSVSNITSTTVLNTENSTSVATLDTTEMTEVDGITALEKSNTISNSSAVTIDNTTNAQERIEVVDDDMKKSVTQSQESENKKSTDVSYEEDQKKETFAENKLITADGITESLNDILMTTDTTTIIMPEDLLVVNITMHSNLSITENNKTESIVTASPPPSRSIPPEIEAILNITNKKDDDYEYDYNEPSLPPSLPNLRIIPFVAADAVVESMEKGSPTIYPIPENLRPTDSPIFFKASHPNLFSPPIETEGGFLPREPIIDGPFYESKFDLTYHTTNKNMPVDHLSLENTASTVTPQSITVPPKSKDDNCLSDGRDYHHGELLSKPDACIMCVCYFGEIHCHPPKCPTVKTGCRRVKEIDHSSCCGRIVCDEEESPTVVLDRIDVTSNPLQSPLLGGIVPPITVAEGVVTPDPFRDVIRTEAAPDLPSLIGNMNPYLLERHSTGYSTSTSPFPSLWSWTNLSSAEPASSTPTVATTTSTTTTTTTTTDRPHSAVPPKTTERHTITTSHNSTDTTKLTSSTPSSPVYQSNAPTSTRIGTPIEFTTLTPHYEKEENTEDFEKEDEDSFSLDSVFKLLFSSDEQTTSRPRPTPPRPDAAQQSIDRIDEHVGQDDHNHTHLLEQVNLGGGGGGDNNASNDLPYFRPDIVLSESPGRPLLGDPVAASGLLKLAGCNIYGRMYRVGRIISELSSPCLECMCTEIGVQCRKLSC